MNPAEYQLSVDIPEKMSGEYRIEHFHEPPGSTLELASMRTALLGGDPRDSVKFEERTRWHRLLYEGGTWMTDLPIEQFQMRKHVESFRGGVLIGGLGLGVVVNHLAQRDEIDRIVVIEISPDVINLVEPHLKDPDDKVSVIRADLFEWMANTTDEFDFAFFDIWQTDGETTFLNTVVPLRKLAMEKCMVQDDADIECWQEQLMRGQLYFSLVSRLANTTHVSSLDYTGPAEINEDLYANEVGNIYWDWSVPYFKWLLEKDRSKELIQRRMAEYAGIYGRSDWEEQWILLTISD